MYWKEQNEIHIFFLLNKWDSYYILTFTHILYPFGLRVLRVYVECFGFFFSAWAVKSYKFTVYKTKITVHISKNIKNRFHGTIYKFKNNFIKMFLDLRKKSSIQFNRSDYITIVLCNINYEWYPSKKKKKKKLWVVGKKKKMISSCDSQTRKLSFFPHTGKEKKKKKKKFSFSSSPCIGKHAWNGIDFIASPWVGS